MTNALSSSPTIMPPEPLIRIRPTSRWQAINFRELWAFRDLVHIMAGRDVKLRYRQTALGVIWVVMQPLMGAAIFSFLSGVIAKTPTEGPRFLFTFASFIAWTAFSQTLTKSSTVLISNANLVSKVYFPRLVLPISSMVSVLIDFLIGLVMLGFFMACWRVTPGWPLLLLPVWLLLMQFLALGIGLIAAGLTVQYRDVQFVLPVMIQFLLFVSPIWYPRSAMPEKYQLFYSLNPLSGLLDAFRWSVLGQAQVQWGSVAYSAVLSLAMMVIGAYSFRSMERRFADVI
jgi:lipopolysaccharide transport system permease protein